MSFISLLFFASVIYFVNGRPESIHNVHSEEITSTIPDQLDAFIKEMDKVVEQTLMPILSLLEEGKREEILRLGRDGLKSYIAYIIHKWNESVEEESSSSSSSSSSSCSSSESDESFDSYPDMDEETTENIFDSYEDLRDFHSQDE